MNAKELEILKIKNQIICDDEFLNFAVVEIYKQQTIDEQQESSTKHHNNYGFCSFDAKRGSYYAKWIMAGNKLSGNFLEQAREMMLKYAGQLFKIMFEKEEKYLSMERYCIINENEIS